MALGLEKCLGWSNALTGATLELVQRLNWYNARTGAMLGLIRCLDWFDTWTRFWDTSTCVMREFVSMMLGLINRHLDSFPDG